MNARSTEKSVREKSIGINGHHDMACADPEGAGGLDAP